MNAVLLLTCYFNSPPERDSFIVEWKREMNINGPSVCYLGHKALHFHHAFQVTKEDMVKMHEFLEIWYFTIKLHCNCSSWREGKKR